MEPGVSVSAVARRHSLNANMVFVWRDDPRFGPGREVAAFLPVEIEPDRLPRDRPVKSLWRIVWVVSYAAMTA